MPVPPPAGLKLGQTATELPMRPTTLALLGLLTALPAPLPAAAEEVREAIAEAQKAWQAGDEAATRAALAEASQLLAQRAATQLVKLLPAPLSGWTAEEAESSASAAGLLGGISASRAYRQGDDQEVEVKIVTDNPMIAQMAAMLSNPAIAGSMGRLVRLGSLRAVQDKDGDIRFMAAGRFLVTVEGSAPAEAKLAYARAIGAAAFPP
jgi:hypothetical protein